MMFCFPLFSLFPAMKNMLPMPKIRSVLFVNFITFNAHSFNYIKFDLFIFQFHPLTFNFHIKLNLFFYFKIF